MLEELGVGGRETGAMLSKRNRELISETRRDQPKGVIIHSFACFRSLVTHTVMTITSLEVISSKITKSN